MKNCAWQVLLFNMFEGRGQKETAKLALNVGVRVYLRVCLPGCGVCLLGLTYSTLPLWRLPISKSTTTTMK